MSQPETPPDSLAAAVRPIVDAIVDGRVPFDQVRFMDVFAADARVDTTWLDRCYALPPVTFVMEDYSAEKVVQLLEQGRELTVQGKITGLGARCVHAKAYVSSPPATTNQTGHRCPDCGAQWLTFPSAEALIGHANETNTAVQLHVPEAPASDAVAEFEAWVESLPPVDPPLKELKPGENPWLE